MMKAKNQMAADLERLLNQKEVRIFSKLIFLGEKGEHVMKTSPKDCFCKTRLQ